MNDEEELRDRLRAVDVPATRIEIDALVQAGRRRAFRRHSVQGAGGVALAAAVLAAVPSIVTAAGTHPGAAPAGGRSVAATASADGTPTAAARTTSAPRTTPAASAGGCPATELPVPAGMTDVTAGGVDPTGRYIVGNAVVGQDFRPVLWTDGTPRALPVPGRSVQVTAVNASGIAVGLVEDGEQEYVFRYEDGAYTRLRTPAGKWHVYPTPAVNASGDVVINAEPRGNSGGKDSIVLLWRAGSTAAVKLPLPAGANVHAITDDGTVVGAMYRNGVAKAAYVWDQRGRGRKLAVPAGETGAAYAAQGVLGDGRPVAVPVGGGVGPADRQGDPAARGRSGRGGQRRRLGRGERRRAARRGRGRAAGARRADRPGRGRVRHGPGRGARACRRRGGPEPGPARVAVLNPHRDGSAGGGHRHRPVRAQRADSRARSSAAPA